MYVFDWGFCLIKIHENIGSIQIFIFYLACREYNKPFILYIIFVFYLMLGLFILKVMAQSCN